jgi:hypothetical protein
MTELQGKERLRIYQNGWDDAMADAAGSRDELLARIIDWLDYQYGAAAVRELREHLGAEAAAGPRRVLAVHYPKIKPEGNE